METNIAYQSEERLQAFIRRMAQFGGTTVSLAQPSLEVSCTARQTGGSLQPSATRFRGPARPTRSGSRRRTH